MSAAGPTVAAPAGEHIFRDQCARCHGASGEGTEDYYPDPLEGDKSVAQLTKLIHETMPDDAETKLAADQAAIVAAYIYDAFYSPEARTRNKPARVELSRLTVRQYQNAVADLIGSFRPRVDFGSEHGLRANYGARRSPSERIDSEVHFDFSAGNPDVHEFASDEFSIIWQGAVIAPDSGMYEFVVRTGHAARLWINDAKLPLMDNWVRSGSDTEHRAEIRLLGGRAYPLRLAFSQANQGVKGKNKEDKTAPVFISLEWKRPNHTLEVISARYLSPSSGQITPEWKFSSSSWPQVFVLKTRFPPDDRSVGYERGTAISKAWDEATTDAAIETATYVAEHLQELSGAQADAADSEPKLREFCTRFAERAFRRPLEAAQQELYINRQFAQAPDRLAAVKRVVLLVLKSPRFLYREIGGGPADEFDTASRISFGLWDSLPDQALLDAAAAGKLAGRDQILEQLERMLPVRFRSEKDALHSAALVIRGGQHPWLIEGPGLRLDAQEIAARCAPLLRIFPERPSGSGSSD